jgi:hypothetical protein
MPKDLKNMLQEDKILKGKLSKNHRANFKAQLQRELHSSKRLNYSFFKIAASFVVIFGLGSIFYFSNKTAIKPIESAKIESLGSISPELKKIENYYIASINTLISSLEETEENKELLDGYFEKLSELTADYKVLTKELNTEGLNEKTINALIENLQLRLKLLYQLKEQLNELKNLNKLENENIHI